MDFLADFQSKFSVVRTRMDSGLRLSGKIFLALTPVSTGRDLILKIFQEWFLLLFRNFKTPVSTGRDLILKIFQIMTQTYSVH